MAYFLKKSKLKKGLYLQIYESFYNPQKGQTAHRSYKAIGYENELKEKGRDAGALRRSDTNDIFAILARIGWKRTRVNSSGTKRFTLYGMQRCFDRSELED